MFSYFFFENVDRIILVWLSFENVTQSSSFIYASEYKKKKEKKMFVCLNITFWQNEKNNESPLYFYNQKKFIIFSNFYTQLSSQMLKNWIQDFS
jgi:hypothetical protein